MDKEVDRAIAIEKIKTAEDWLMITSNKAEGIWITGSGLPNDLIGMARSLTKFAKESFNNWYYTFKITEADSE